MIELILVQLFRVVIFLVIICLYTLMAITDLIYYTVKKFGVVDGK